MCVCELLSHVQFFCDPHGLQPTRPPCPLNSPGSTGVGCHFLLQYIAIYSTYLDSPGGSDGKASAYNAGDLGLIPGWGRSPGEGNGNPLQYSCLENPMDTVHRVTESDMTERLHFTSLECIFMCKYYYIILIIYYIYLYIFWTYTPQILALVHQEGMSRSGYQGQQQWRVECLVNLNEWKQVAGSQWLAGRMSVLLAKTKPSVCALNPSPSVFTRALPCNCPLSLLHLE